MTALQKIVPETASRIDLLHAIERLGVEATSLKNERSCLPSDVRGRVDYLLREIEETVVPRRIQVWRQEEVLAQLDVSKRRFVSVALTDPSCPQQTVDAYDPDALADILVYLGQRATRIETTRMQFSIDMQAHESCSAADLRSKLFDQRTASELAALGDLLEQDAVAKLTWRERSQTLNCTGEKSWRELLLEIAKKLRDQIRFERDGAMNRDVKGLAIPMAQDRILIVGLSTEGGVAAILSRENGMRAIAMWQLKMA